MFSPPQKQDNPSGNKSDRDELIKSGQVLFLLTEESEQGVHQQNIFLEGHSQLATQRDEPNKVQTILNTEFKDEVDPILVGGQRNSTSQSIGMKESAKEMEVSIPKKKEISVEVVSFNSQQNPADFPVKATSKSPSVSILKKTTFNESSIKAFDVQHQEGFFFQRTKNVNKFFQKIKSKTSSFLMTLVTRNVFTLINDLSSDFFVFTNQRAFKLLV